MTQTQTPATFSAKALSVRISKAIGRTVSPKQVRGRVRGDAGAPLLARFGPDAKADYASHVYTADEADLIGQAFVDAHNKRSDGHARWSPLGRAAQRKAARKAAPRSKAPQTVSKAPQTAPEAQSSNDAQS